MHWLSQVNLRTEEKAKPYIDALNHIKQFGATWEHVKLIPFADTIEPEIDHIGRKIFAIGSTSMMKVSRLKGWMPGIRHNDNFHFERWVEGWGAENLLNGDGIVSEFKDAVINEHKEFIRPCEDWKSFSGQVIDSDHLRDWKKSIINLEKSTRAIELLPETKVVVAPVKRILSEWRLFVVDGKIVTGSYYMNSYGRLHTSRNVDKDILDFARKMIDKWVPIDCFVIDIADTPQGLKIIEINTLNCSGVYDADVCLLFETIEKYYET